MISRVPLTIALVVFFALFVIGLILAQHKPLWNDELYSQHMSVEGLTYGQILNGKIFEGNNNPLFYVLQKLWCDAFRYRLSNHEESQCLYDPHAQIFLRVIPILFIALSAALTFYFFASLFGLVMGIYALLLFCSSLTVWAYIAEARPYGLWLFLTCAQTILLFRRAGGQGAGAQSWKYLGLVHVLLSLTSVFGVVQVIVVNVLLWVGRKMDSPRALIWTLLVPLGIGAFYFWHASKYVFQVGEVANLIFMNVSVERLAMLGLYGFLTLFCASWRPSVLNRAARYVLVFFASLLALSFGLIIYYKFRYVPSPQVFQLATRYFINLAPVSTMAVVLAAGYSMDKFRHDRWMRFNIHLVLTGLVMTDFLRTYSFTIGTYQW